MKQILNRLQVTLAASLLVVLPTFGFWYAGAIEWQAPSADLAPIVSPPIRTGPLAEWRGTAWQSPNPHMGHYNRDPHAGNHYHGNRHSYSGTLTSR